jgi:membrane protein
LITNLQSLLDRIVWENQLTKVGPIGVAVAVVLRYLYAMLRDFFSGQLTMRAMSLVYTTLLSIVPLLAFSFAILGEQGEQITNQILQLVNNVRGSVLGGLGLAFFLYTAISMVQKVEESFNYVWYVAKPRSFARRFTEYLIVLLVGPMAMVTAIGMITSIQSNAAVPAQQCSPWTDIRGGWQVCTLPVDLRRVYVPVHVHAEHQGQLQVGAGRRRCRRLHVGNDGRDIHDLCTICHA